MLIVFAGLPGTGKSAIARELARGLGAVWLRIDSIEQALRGSGVLSSDVEGAGYAIAYRIAEDNLRLGLTVIGDCVNPWELTRAAWQDVAQRAGVEILEVETICSDQTEHQRRIETRNIEVPGLRPPTWRDVIERDYHPWSRDHMVIDTSTQTLASCVERIRAALPVS